MLLGVARGFSPATVAPIRVGRGAYHLAAGDMDGDGRMDFATSSFEGDPVTLLLTR